MIASTYERSGMRITRTKMPCQHFAAARWFKELDNKRVTCGLAQCQRYGTYCIEDFRSAEIKCPHYTAVL